MNKIASLTLCFGSIFLLAGCQSVGPKAIRDVQPTYNESIVKTDSEQLLLNIVRLKYCETPFFLSVSNVVENRKSTTRVGLSGTGLKRHREYTLSAGVAYTEFFQNPTITFSPLKGEAFTKSMATPISMPLVVGLMQTGWSPKRVFGLCVERINGLDNATTASGPTPKRPPNFKEFEKCVRTINRLHKRNQIAFGLDPEDNSSLIMRISNQAASSGDGMLLKKQLGLDLSKSEFRFVSNFFDTKEDNLPVRTRSLIEILFFVSHAVQVPQKDIDDGLVVQTTDKNGNAFDWEHQLSGNLLHVLCSEDRKGPENAYLKVFYRGKWFYIPDNDINSKVSFMFIKNLLNLQSGDPNAAIPSLVIGTN